MNIKNREKLLLSTAGLVIVLLLGDRLVLTPLFGRDGLWKKRNDRIAELAKSLDNGRLLLDREKSISERWEFMKTNALSANLSAAENKVLKSVDHWALTSRVNLASIKPQWKQDSKDDDHMVLDCQVNGSGDILSLARFLYELEKDPLALRIEDLEITARDDNGQQLTLSARFSGLKLNPNRK